MHSLMVKKDFIASHYLIGGDWGNESRPHAHRYVLELVLGGRPLNRHNYLVDIVEVEEVLTSLALRFKDKLLNELPEFEGQNPSIELFSRILCSAISERIAEVRISSLSVTLWENDSAWARYDISRE